MFHIALCDDQKDFRVFLKNELKNQCAQIFPQEIEYTVLPSFESGGAVADYLKEHPIDLLFLDIDMPQMSGFELARMLCREHPKTLIVFVSAYDQFVYSAFEFTPFAFLRKECLKKELPEVLRRVCRRLSDEKRSILLSTLTGDRLFSLSEILYFESKQNYFVVHCTDNTGYSCRGTLSKLEESLRPFDFFRIHSAFLINLQYVCGIREQGCLITGENVPLPLAQRRIPAFRSALDAYNRRVLGL